MNQAGTCRIGVFTLFPEMFTVFLNSSMVRVARERNIVDVTLINPRDYTADAYRSVDDYLYGGAAGMLLSPVPLAAAIRDIRSQPSFRETSLVYLTPQGKPLKQEILQRLSGLSTLLLLCGHYKGIDERLRLLYVNEELSLGDYVLSGGEIASMAVIDGLVRLLPGVLGNMDSAREDSFVTPMLDCPRYTRPDVFEGLAVPDVLRSGHHARIRSWEHREALRRTWERRPDLLTTGTLNAEDLKIIHSFEEEKHASHN